MTAAVAWWWSGASGGGGGAELRLKSTDNAVAQKTMMNWAMLDENKPIPVGTTLQTRGARKTVFATGGAEVTVAKDGHTSVRSYPGRAPPSSSLKGVRSTRSLSTRTRRPPSARTARWKIPTR
ncbi:MAG: hypothetical protein FJX76_25215 [Armatimonadetes bacterium]|nr:hypothetical protein [Armatimonadota bacterium]